MLAALNGHLPLLKHFLEKFSIKLHRADACGVCILCQPVEFRARAHTDDELHLFASSVGVLQAAVVGGHEDVITFLCERGANIDVTDSVSANVPAVAFETLPDVRWRLLCGHCSTAVRR